MAFDPQKFIEKLKKHVDLRDYHLRAGTDHSDGCLAVCESELLKMLVEATPEDFQKIMSVFFSPDEANLINGVSPLDYLLQFCRNEKVSLNDRVPGQNNYWILDQVFKILHQASLDQIQKDHILECLSQRGTAGFLPTKPLSEHYIQWIKEQMGMIQPQKPKFDAPAFIDKLENHITLAQESKSNEVALELADILSSIEESDLFLIYDTLFTRRVHPSFKTLEGEPFLFDPYYYMLKRCYIPKEHSSGPFSKEKPPIFYGTLIPLLRKCMLAKGQDPSHIQTVLAHTDTSDSNSEYMRHLLIFANNVIHDSDSHSYHTLEHAPSKRWTWREYLRIGIGVLVTGLALAILFSPLGPAIPVVGAALAGVITWVGGTAGTITAGVIGSIAAGFLAAMFDYVAGFTLWLAAEVLMGTLSFFASLFSKFTVGGIVYIKSAVLSLGILFGLLNKNSLGGNDQKLANIISEPYSYFPFLLKEFFIGLAAVLSFCFGAAFFLAFSIPALLLAGIVELSDKISGISWVHQSAMAVRHFLTGIINRARNLGGVSPPKTETQPESALSPTATVPLDEQKAEQHTAKKTFKELPAFKAANFSSFFFILSERSSTYFKDVVTERPFEENPRHSESSQAKGPN